MAQRKWLPRKSKRSPHGGLLACKFPDARHSHATPKTKTLPPAPRAAKSPPSPFLESPILSLIPMTSEDDTAKIAKTMVKTELEKEDAGGKEACVWFGMVESPFVLPAKRLVSPTPTHLVSSREIRYTAFGSEIERQDIQRLLRRPGCVGQTAIRPDHRRHRPEGRG